ncbi:MAG: hypothetical protein Q7J67_04800 [bacterium]|nr:hypothetical protein [bacterium]
MSKTTKELIMTAILVGVLVFVVINQVGKAKKKTSPAKEGKSIVSVEKQKKEKKEEVILPSKVTPELKEIIELQKAKASEQYGRDPFFPSAEVSEGKEMQTKGHHIASLVLKGIAWKGKTPMALIGDKIVKEGDIVGEYKVISIQKNRVVLTKDGKELILTQE